MMTIQCFSTQTTSAILLEQAADLTELIYKHADPQQKGFLNLQDMKPFFVTEQDRLYAFSLLDRVSVH